MQEFPRTTCLYHPSQSITNFCKQKSCLMPLCPTCICSHLELHIKQGKSIPQFDNITDSLTNTYKEIKQYGERFEESRVRLVQDDIIQNTIEKSISDKKKELLDLVYNTKVQMREMVDACFAELEKELEGSIMKQNQLIGMHQPQHIDDIEKRIIQVSSKLREMLGDLKGEAYLGTLITYFHEGKVSIQKQFQQIIKTLKNNQQYFPVITLNHDAATKIRQSLTKVINLRFNFPQPSTSKIQVSERDNNLVGYETSRITMNSTRSPLSKIGNSPSRLSNNHKMTSPGRYGPKSFLQGPTSPRISTDGLPVFSQVVGKSEN